MIVTCEECSTSFQLDEARIPASGARVRCSKCKHAFFLPNPSASESEAVHSVAETAAADPSALSAPTASSDLNPNNTLGGFGDVPSTDPNTEPATGPGASRGSVLDEEDWQFSEEVRIEGDEPDDDFGDGLGDDLSGGPGGDLDDGPGADVDVGSDMDAGGIGGDFLEDPSDLSGDLADVARAEPGFGEGLDESALFRDSSESPPVNSPAEPEIASAAASDEGSGSGLELDSDSGGVEPARDESSFGSVDDFSSLMQDDDESAADVVGNLASEIGSELGAPDSDLGPGTYSESGKSDELGDPESWDLVGSDKPVPEIPATRLGDRSSIAQIAEEDFFSDEVFGDGYDVEATGRAALPRWLVRGASAMGWAATLAAIGGVVFLGLEAEWLSWSTTPPAVVAGPVSATALETGWVETSRSGAVLRVAGELHNTGSNAIAPGRLALVLLDAHGTRLETPAIDAGRPLDATILREASPDVLLAHTSAAARALRRPLAAGEVRPFEVIIPEGRLPAQAARIRLELADPSSADRRSAPPAAATRARDMEAAAGVESARAGGGGAPARPSSPNASGALASDGPGVQRQGTSGGQPGGL